MRGMGVKAVAMAKIASQASPTAHIRLGAATTQEKMLRQVGLELGLGLRWYRSEFGPG